jgi:ABC-type spermidine/putrescine transport system permease subunit II
MVIDQDLYVLVYVFMFAPIVVVIVLAFNPKQFGIFPMEGVSFAGSSNWPKMNPSSRRFRIRSSWGR